MSLKQQPVILSFDPGGTTGVAVVGEKGNIIRTEALNADQIVGHAERLHRKYESAVVVIERGPVWRSDSPLTRNVEGKLRQIFPNAALVTPNKWKGHPTARCDEKLPTRHQRDAVCLARWFLSKGALNGNTVCQADAA
jgi:predicted RNase H-like nuclease (RuvC/YqgF family)